jgi:hypothetical protein
VRIRLALIEDAPIATLARLTDAERRAIAGRLEARFIAMGVGRMAPTRAASYTPPKPETPDAASRNRAAENRAGLERFVAGQIALAAGKTPEAAHAFLDAWAASLNADLHRLGACDTPDRLAGLTAFELAEARDRLSNAVGSC